MKKDEPDPGEATPAPMIRASKRARALAATIWVGGVLLGPVLILWLLPHGEQYASAQEPQTMLRILQTVMGLLFLSVSPLGAYLLWFGHRVRTSCQFPPPGTWVLRDTKVVEGDRARLRGRILMILGMLLLAVSLFGTIYFPYRIGAVFGSRLAP